jgi:cytochrome c-L
VSGINKHLLLPLIMFLAMAAASLTRASGQTATTEPSRSTGAAPGQSETPATPPTESKAPAPGPAQPAPAADLAAVLTPKSDDTPAVRQFKETGKNPYYRDPKAITDGFRLARASACTHCHGESLGGLIGPSLTNGNWRHVRNGTDKGMFETLYFGTTAGMAAWGKLGSLTEDEILKVMAFVRSKYQGDPKNITWE